MEIIIPQKVTNNFQGNVFFTDLFWNTKQCYKDEVILNFEETKIIESNLFSVLGCIIASLERKRNKVRFVNIPDSISNLFNTKKEPKKDVWKTMIKCQHFSSSDEGELSKYLEDKIFPDRPELNTNAHLKMAIQLCVAEIFRNAFVHSRCRELFISHYFSVYNKKLFITVVNQAKSMKDIVRRSDCKTDVAAIEWAVQSGTTSKKPTHSGIGLYTIRQFIEQNQGKIQILSGAGVWKQVKHRTFTKFHDKSFPGSIITLEFNLEE